MWRVTNVSRTRDDRELVVRTIDDDGFVAHIELPTITDPGFNVLEYLEACHTQAKEYTLATDH